MISLFSQCFSCYLIVYSISSSGKAIISGHSDGSIVRYIFAEENTGETHVTFTWTFTHVTFKISFNVTFKFVYRSQGVVCRHSCPPYALAWTPFGIVVGGCDKRIVVYTKEGRLLQQFDYSRDSNEKEFSVAESNPTGQMVVVGSFNRLRIFNWSPRKGLFEESDPKEFTNLYTLTSISWKRDGSRLAIVRTPSYSNRNTCPFLFYSQMFLIPIKYMNSTFKKRATSPDVWIFMTVAWRSKCIRANSRSLMSDHLR